MCERILDAALEAMSSAPDGSMGLTQEGRAVLSHELSVARQDGFLGEARDTLEKLARVFEARSESRAARELLEIARQLATFVRIDDLLSHRDDFAVVRRPVPPAPRLRARAPSSPAHRFLRGGRPGLVIIR